MVLYRGKKNGAARGPVDLMDDFLFCFRLMSGQPVPLEKLLSPAHLLLEYATSKRNMLRDSKTSPQTSPHADLIAATTIDLHAALPRHCKPIIRSNGIPEWTILSSIILSSPSGLLPISLGSGVKVISANRLPPLGDAVHDCHAEILARRGFMRWLVEEATRIIRGEGHSDMIRYSDGRFRMKDDAEVWLYVSALPVGTYCVGLAFDPLRTRISAATPRRCILRPISPLKWRR